MQEKKQKISPIKQRILLYADTLGISKRDFYKEIEVSRGTLESSTGITEDIVAKFIARYPEISIEWLITGAGSMLRENVMQSQLEPTIVYVDNPANAIIAAQREDIIALQKDQIKYLNKENNDLKQENEDLKNALTALSKSGASYTGSQETQAPISPPK